MKAVDPVGVELVGVTKRFGPVRVLTDVDLVVPAGRRTVIVGASGSGKTTLLRLISGFETPDAGQITIGGRPVSTSGQTVPAHRRGVGYVAQDGALFPHLSVGQNVGFGLDPGCRGKLRRAAVGSLLELVSLDPAFAARRPYQLSGGQQQRVALARALARAPQVMLLDEPFSALDTGLRTATRDVVSDTLKRAGVTTVLVTHDHQEALSFADHLVVLRDGTVLQAGPPKTLYDRPSDVFTAELLGDSVVLDALAGDRSARCALGEVSVVPSALRGNVRLLFRPEQLVVQRGGATGHGRVTALAYYGAEAAVSVLLDAGAPGGQPQIVRIRQSGGVDIAVGDRADIRCLADGLVLPEPTSGPRSVAHPPVRPARLGHQGTA